MDNLKDIINPLKLRRGAGGSYDNGLCLMESVAWLSGEGATDHPKCACPILTEFAIRLNDFLECGDRQILIPFAIGLVGTRSKEHEDARLKCLLFGVTRLVVEQELVKLGLTEHAENIMSAKTYKELNEACLESLKFMKRCSHVLMSISLAAMYAHLGENDNSVWSLSNAISDCSYDDKYDLKLIIPVLGEAIRLGPNGFDEFEKYMEPAKALGEHAKTLEDA